MCSIEVWGTQGCEDFDYVLALKMEAKPSSEMLLTSKKLQDIAIQKGKTNLRKINL